MTAHPIRSLAALVYQLKAIGSETSAIPSVQEFQARLMTLAESVDVEHDDAAEVERLKGELIAERRRIVDFLSAIQSRIDACTAKEPAE